MTAILFAALLFQSAIGDHQQEAKQRAEILLSSASVLDKAWGAYEAGRLRDDSLNKLLIDRLAEAQIYVDSEPASEERAYVFALFDALIESGVKVPPDVLLPFREHWLDETLILLARGEATEDLLLAMREEKLNEAQWLTVNNLLFQMRSAGFFARTLKELEIKQTITVVDSNGTGLGSGSGGGGVGDGI